MAEKRPDRAPTGPAAPRPAQHDHPGDRPADHQPPDARTPEEYTETPGSHRRGPRGPATDVGA
jgi:hypothetical protein